MIGTVARRSVAVVALLAATAVGGCERHLDTDYAAIRGPSINGIAAFVQLLRDAGRRTTARQFLPREIDQEYDTVVVFDHGFDALADVAAERLTSLLDAERPRTLVLVLRDSDGVIAYLQDILAGDELDASRRTVAQRLLGTTTQDLARATAEVRRASSPFPDRLEPHQRPAAAEALSVRVRPGSGLGSRRVTVRWPLARRLDPGSLPQPLWDAAGEPLLVRRRLGDDTVLVLASAAPLLNGGLVDPGCRELAEELVSLLPADGRVLVVGSTWPAGDGDGGDGGDGDGGGGDGDGDEEEPSPWRLLAVQPLPWVLLQALLAMGLFCWCTAPIFGRPKRSSPSHAQDFGHHVEALASLVARGPAAADGFCEQRLADWRKTMPARPGPHRRRQP